MLSKIHSDHSISYFDFFLVGIPQKFCRNTVVVNNIVLFGS